MKIISIEAGIAVRSFVMDEIKPIGGVYLPELIRMTTERYGFVASPSPADAAKAGALFQGGVLISGGSKITIQAMTVFGDGLNVKSVHTDAAEFILEDALNWLMTTFGVRTPITPPKTTYESHVVVEFDSSIERALRIFEDMKMLFEATLKTTYGQDFQVNLSRIGIGCDPKIYPGLPRSDLGIERRNDFPFSGNRYFSVAPLKTNTHLDLLYAFEGFAK